MPPRSSRQIAFGPASESHLENSMPGLERACCRHNKLPLPAHAPSAGSIERGTTWTMRRSRGLRLGEEPVNPHDCESSRPECSLPREASPSSGWASAGVERSARQFPFTVPTSSRHHRCSVRASTVPSLAASERGASHPPRTLAKPGNGYIAFNGCPAVSCAPADRSRAGHLAVVAQDVFRRSSGFSIRRIRQQAAIEPERASARPFAPRRS